MKVTGDTDRHGTDDALQARQADLRGHRVQLRPAVQPPARAGVPQQGPADRASPTTGPSPPKSHLFHFDGGVQSFIEYLNKNKELIHAEPVYFDSERDLVRVEVVAAVQRRVRGDHLHLREQHQHARGRHAPRGLQERPHPVPQRLPEEAEPREEARGEPERRRRARGPDRRHLGEGARAAVRGPDQGATGQQRGEGHRREHGLRPAVAVLRREPRRRQEDPRQVHHGRPGARGRAQGAGADAQEGPARELGPARQARGLQRGRPVQVRALHRGGRLARAAAPSRAATASSRPSFRSGARC